MYERLDLFGVRFGKLTVIDIAEIKQRVGRFYPPPNGKTKDGWCVGGTVIYWRCRCDCGNEIVKTAASLRWYEKRLEAGVAKTPLSCGCSWRIPDSLRKRKKV